MDIVSFSGGKDSTAMLLMLIERGYLSDYEIVFFDGGWEFPQMYKHIARVEELVGKRITIIRENFEYYAAFHTYTQRNGKTRRGYGWPAPHRRWCTRLKISAIQRYMRSIDVTTQYIAISAEEYKRAKPQPKKRYPLVEWNVTGKEALRYCRARGLDWDGLYDYFDRVSCFCCPLKKLRDFRILYSHFPDLWSYMLHLDEQINPNLGFYGYEKVRDLDLRFSSLTTA